MIQPTNGRQVLYVPSPADLAGNFGMVVQGTTPLAATVVAVHSERCVNLQVLDANAKAYQRWSVTLLQDDDVPLQGSAYAIWMPYQIKAAAAEVGDVEKQVPIAA